MVMVLMDEHSCSSEDYWFHLRNRREQKPPSISDLPCHLLIDILSRLPIKSLLQCRCVSKTWLNFLSDPHFHDPYLATAPISLLIKPFYPNRTSKILYLYDLQGTKMPGIGTPHCAPPNDSKSRIKLRFSSNLPNLDLRLVNSCNGLLCLCDPETNDPIYVCNPILGQYITLPRADQIGVKCHGFGFCPESKQYKVMRVTDKNPFGVEVYTLGSGSWRSIGNAPYLFDISSSFNTFVNGALHWLVSTVGSSAHIRCFDFENERFRAVPAPKEYDPVVEEGVKSMNLGVLRGCLSICDFSGEHLYIWLMKKYGVKESWTKEFVIFKYHLDDYIRGRYERRYDPILILDSGEVLFLTNHDAFALLLFKPRSYSGTCTPISIYRVKAKFRAIAHVPSFVSLKDVAKGENLKVTWNCQWR